ncbi:MAG TPA: peptide-methionine (S)-S-oxide reductase MsrA [Ginsengibacter sp.]|nr:peptide-methionine (S)-S-oxide reductase MsrA [Ginsengibacter sp.]HRP44770.1 peptide-methionine (S)-S-oxide reductase MsrA [Ginsengibacter sp.]
MMSQYDIATFANGCFWCTEAVFQRLRGVINVQSGYSGGHTPNPSYREVCTGNTGHAECLQITYDPSVITYSQLLEVFWATHDPTTLNRQGNDVGTQYRSVIFYHTEEQKEAAEKSLKLLEKEKVFDAPIVTAIQPFDIFYPAEKEHGNYYNNHPLQPYCYYVTRPKVEKLKKLFADWIEK